MLQSQSGSIGMIGLSRENVACSCAPKETATWTRHESCIFDVPFAEQRRSSCGLCDRRVTQIRRQPEIPVLAETGALKSLECDESHSGRTIFAAPRTSLPPSDRAARGACKRFRNGPKDKPRPRRSGTSC